MTDNDLKSRTPGPINEASRPFVDRIARRDEGIGGTSSDLNRPMTTADPDPEIDDTSLPLDNRSDGSVAQSEEDIDDDRADQPESNNPDDAAEDETVVR